MKSYRVAIIGCGPRGTAIAQGYAAHPRTEVVALCDLRPDHRDRLAAALGVAACYADLDQMMAVERPDIVVIATGTEFHYDLCLRVLEYGAHIDVEKPLCTNLEEADRLLAAANSRGVCLAVHHQSRLGPPLQAVRRAIAAGQIGEVRALIANDKGYYGGYGLMNLATHLINNFLALAGRCQGVSAVATVAGRPITPEDVVVAPGGMGIVAGERITAMLDFPAGVVATVMCRHLPRADALAHGIEILGTTGRILWKTTDAWWLPVPHHAPDGTHDQWQPLPAILPEGYDPARGAYPDEYAFADEMVRAIEEGREHDCSGAEAHHVLEVLMGILESAAYGRRVPLPQTRRDHPLLRWRHEAGLGDPEPRSRDYDAWIAEEDARLGR